MRQLTWDDVRVSFGHKNRQGKQRVHVSLRNASFICWTAWVFEWDTDQFRALVLLELSRRGASVQKRLANYLTE